MATTSAEQQAQGQDQEPEQSQNATVVAEPAPSTPKISTADLESLLLSATPEQLARLRMAAAVQGVSASAEPRKTADGSSVFEIQVSADLMAQIEQWSDALPPGTSLNDQIQHWVTEALNAYLYADWRVVTPPAPVTTGA